MNNDRTTGVKECESKSRKRPEQLKLNKLSRLNYLFVGEYCLFKNVEYDLCLVVLINGFGYINKKKWKDLQYSNNCVDLEKESENLNKGKKKRIGVYGGWFSVDPDNNSLVLVELSCQGYIGTAQYILIIPKPSKVYDKFVLSEDVFEKIKHHL